MGDFFGWVLEFPWAASNLDQLAPEWLDHPLTGDWAGHRECHIGGDFLLIYWLDDTGKSGLVVFVRSGTPRWVSKHPSTAFGP